MSTSPMGDGGGRLARFVGALMECRVRIGSPPRVRGRRRQIRDAAVRRGIVPLLHGPRPHRPDPHAPSPLVVAVRRILEKKKNVKRETSSLHETRSTKFFVRPTNASHFHPVRPSKKTSILFFFSLKRRSSYESRKEVDDFQGGNETRGTRREIPAKSPR